MNIKKKGELMMNQPIVSVDHVKKKIRGKTLLHNISFTLKKGDICGFIGPNGAGKTTLIRIMTGLIKPTAGEVKVKQYSVQQNRREALESVGAIVESPIFFSYLTGREALLNLAVLHANLSFEEQRERVEEVLQLTDLLEHSDKKVGTYSLGMKQRLGIAQALLGKPDCIILDEPANGLDPMGMKFLRELIVKLRNDYNITFLISSHLLGEIQQICDHLVIINKGEVIWKGHMENLKQETTWLYTFKDAAHCDKAIHIMKDKYPFKEQSSTKIEIKIAEEEAEALTDRFVQEGIAIRGMEEQTQRLEEMFMEMMKS